MRLATTYICVENMEKSLVFYKSLLQKEPLYVNEDRWITFDCGSLLSLYNKKYDEKRIEKNDTQCFNQAYLDDFYLDEGSRKNNIVVFNFEVTNLKAEYERIKAMQIGEVSQLMYVHVHMPYWYFNVKDPDGNILEITQIVTEDK